MTFGSTLSVSWEVLKIKSSLKKNVIVIKITTNYRRVIGVCYNPGDKPGCAALAASHLDN